MGGKASKDQSNNQAANQITSQIPRVNDEENHTHLIRWLEETQHYERERMQLENNALQCNVAIGYNALQCNDAIGYNTLPNIVNSPINPNIIPLTQHINVDAIRKNTLNQLEESLIKLTNLKDIETKDEDKQCIICISNEKNIVLNCGHMNMCATCAIKIINTNKKCPMCNVSIISATKLYSS